MGLASCVMIALADDAVFGDDNGPNHRVGAGFTEALRSEAKSQRHIVEISCAVRHRFLRLAEGFLGAGLARFTDFDAFADFTVLTRAVTVFLDADGLASASAIAA
jgi:hypothetical protein